MIEEQGRSESCLRIRASSSTTNKPKLIIRFARSNQLGFLFFSPLMPAVQAAVGEWPKFGLYAGAACSLRDVSANTTGLAANPYLIRLTDKMAIASVTVESASGPVAATNEYSINVANMNVIRSISLLVSQDSNANASLFYSPDIFDFWVGNLTIDSSRKVIVTATFIARLP